MEGTAREFLRALRGRRSQVAFSRRLGYASNVAAQWESGRRTPPAYEVLRHCQRLNRNVPRALREFHPGSAPLLRLDQPQSVSKWLDAHRGRMSLAEAASRTGLSRFQVARFLHGHSNPRLHQFFLLVDVFTSRLPDLVAGLVDIEGVPSARALHERALRLKTLFVQLPWAGPVITLIETTAYQESNQEDTGFFAARLGVSTDVVDHCINQLSELGLIALDRRSGKWRNARPVTVDASGQARWSLRKHWATESARRIGQRREEDLFSYNVFAISRADLERIRELQRAYFRDIRAIVAGSEPSETAALVTMHLTEWSGDSS